MSNTKIIIILVVIVVALLGVSFLTKKGPEQAYANLDEFAQCLASKQVTMYGAEWCPHCKNEKARFGDSFKYVPYVECPDNPQLCVDKGVTGFPTWVLSDGTKLVGEQGLERLSSAASCPLVPNAE